LSPVARRLKPDCLPPPSPPWRPCSRRRLSLQSCRRRMHAKRAQIFARPCLHLGAALRATNGPATGEPPTGGAQAAPAAADRCARPAQAAASPAAGSHSSCRLASARAPAPCAAGVKAGGRCGAATMAGANGSASAALVRATSFGSHVRRPTSRPTSQPANRPTGRPADQPGRLLSARPWRRYSRRPTGGGGGATAKPGNRRTCSQSRPARPSARAGRNRWAGRRAHLLRLNPMGRVGVGAGWPAEGQSGWGRRSNRCSNRRCNRRSQRGWSGA